MGGEPAAIIGRTAEIERLVELVDTSRFVTVTGPGGVGKTHLVNSARVGIDAAFARVEEMQLIGADSGSDADSLCARAGWASPEAIGLSLAGQSGIVILDGCDHVADGCADIVRRLRHTNDAVAVIATSREPLGFVDEHLLEVGPLPVREPVPGDPWQAPAVRLFVERATAAGATIPRDDTNLGAIVELCERIDGLPLAIELAASRSRTLSPIELLGYMERRLDVLAVRRRDGHTHHHSIRAAIDVSSELLDRDQRTVLHRLAFFRGPFDIALAHSVAGADSGDQLATVDHLTDLVNRSLVVVEATPGGRRFRLLELVRAYAIDELTTTGEREAIGERFVDAMCSVALALLNEISTRWVVDVVDRLHSHLDNILGAIEWCITEDEVPERAFTLIMPMFAAVHDRRTAAVRHAAEAVFRRWPTQEGKWRGEALAILATAYAVAADRDNADRAGRETLAMPSASALARTLAHRAMLLGALTADDVEPALAHARAGAAVAQAGSLHSFDRNMRGFEASLLARLGDNAGAVALAAIVVDESDVAHDPINELWARVIAMNVAAREGRWHDVQAQLCQARPVATRVTGSAFLSAALLDVLDAESGTALDGWDAARPRWHDAIHGAASRGELAELAMSLGAAASAAEVAGHHEAAATLAAAIPSVIEMRVLPDTIVAPAPAPLERHDASAGSATDRLRRALDALQAPTNANEANRDESDGDVVHASARPRTLDDDRPRLVAEGELWAITFAGTTVRVRARKGISDLAVLLDRPDVEVHCLELMGAADIGGAMPATDDRARNAYRSRILDLQSEIDEAREMNDPVRAERAELELDALVEELSASLGLGGKVRNAGSSAERARSAVAYRIRAAITKIGELHPPLGRHLGSAVRMGTWCAYRPETPTHWEIHAGAG